MSEKIRDLQIKEKVNKRTPLEEVVPLETPFIVNIDPCGACNFKCSFCPCNNSDFKTAERHKTMSLDHFKKITDDLKGFKQQIRAVDLYAFGEPLLNKNIIEMIKYLKASGTAQKIRMVTNGSLLTPELNNKLIESGLDILKISVEGINSEDYKNLCIADVNMDEFLANIKDLYDKKSKLEGEQNPLIQIKAVNSMLKTEEEKKLYFDMFNNCSDSCIIENVKDIWSEFEVAGSAKESDKWDYERLTGSGNICSMPLYQMTIHSNGIVSACCVDWKFATEYGNAFSENVVDIWHSKRLRDFQIKLIEEGRQAFEFCKSCTYFGGDNIDNTAGKILERLKSAPYKDLAADA